MEEVWKDIPGHEGSYQASSLGRIRSIDRTVQQTSRRGRPFTRRLKGQVLRPAASKRDPHLYVVLHHGGATPVHTLVATAFLGPRPKGADIRHLDGVATNNRVENLCYGSRSENNLDAFRQGKAWKKLTLEDIRNIHSRLQHGETGVALARKYRVSQTTISKIKLGRYKSCSII